MIYGFLIYDEIKNEMFDVFLIRKLWIVGKVFLSLWCVLYYKLLILMRYRILCHFLHI